MHQSFLVLVHGPVLSSQYKDCGVILWLCYYEMYPNCDDLTAKLNTICSLRNNYNIPQPTYKCAHV